MEEGEEKNSIKKVFINPTILEEDGSEWNFSEGCLSIPDIREEVKRKSIITIKYQDENFEWYTDTFDGLTVVLYNMNMIILRVNYLLIIFLL